MNRIWMTLFAALCLSACLSKPAPWSPTGDVSPGLDSVEVAGGEVDGTAVQSDLVEPDPELPNMDADAEEVGADVVEIVDAAEVNEVEPDLCQPACEGKECGDDGCGGECGVCPGAAPVCIEDEGVCCAPDCDDKECGPDGCGDVCGVCSVENPDCLAGACTCNPKCDGKECGDDQCGGECGTCDGETPDCLDGDCVCDPKCTDKECGDDQCGGLCGECGEGLQCLDDGLCGCQEGVACGDACCGEAQACTEQLTCCTPSCEGLQCGNDECGNSCGECVDGCQCVDNACQCGCPEESECSDGEKRCVADNSNAWQDCIVFSPECSDKWIWNPAQPNACPPDSPDCVAGECVCSPDCDGAECGVDGCGGSCGSCDDGISCTVDECKEGACKNEPPAGQCVVGLECVLEGTPDGIDYCQVCEPIQSTYGFSPAPDGTECGPWMVCHLGECCDPSDSCVGKSCGDDGCGGECGDCSQLCDCTEEFVCDCGCPAEGECLEGETKCNDDATGVLTCELMDAPCEHLSVWPAMALDCPGGSVCVDADCCILECEGKECGDDGCGGECGDCAPGDTCVDGLCFGCLPQCEGKECGPDTCGGSCGDCGAGWSCNGSGCQWDGACEGLDGQPCVDPDPCMLDATCNNGICAGFAGCDDSNACTTDSCVDGVGCQHVEIACDDGNQCTDDYCDPVLVECVFDPLDGACDDGNPCTADDECFGEDGCIGQLDMPVCDWDHDGAIDALDGCPYTYDAGGQAGAACPAWDQALPLSRIVTLSDQVTDPAQRRTFQPVEVPLANGWLDATVLGYWTLDGGTADDLSDNENHGDVVGNPTSQPGKFGNVGGAFEFNGFTQHIDLAGPEGVADGLLGAYTVSCWFKIMLNVSGRRIWDDESQTSSSRLVVVGDGSVQFEMDTTEGPVVALCGTPLEDQWQHVAATWDGATLTCYLNGHREGAAGADDTVAGASGTRLGAAAAGGSVFVGMIDEVVFSARAWKAEEVAIYHRSALPYATRLLPGAQIDFDDVRVTELPVEDDVEFYARSEVRGVRPNTDSDTPGLVAHWRFNGDTTDLINGFNASLDAGVELVKGRFGEPVGALGFGPGADAAVVGSPPELAFADGSQTIEAWVRMGNPNSGTVYLVDKQHSAISAAYTMAISTNKLYCLFKSSSGVLQFFGETTINDRGWHHVACVLDRTKMMGFAYLDGLLDGEDPIPGGFGSVQHPDPLRFGIGAAGFLLELDEVRIHGAARSADYFYTNTLPVLPVVRLLASTSRGDVDGAYPYHGYTLRWGDPDAQTFVPSVSDPGGGDECPGLLNECAGYVGWWRFDEGRGTAAMDSSSNGNHGLYMDLDDDEAVAAEPQFTGAIDGRAVAFNGIGTHVAVPSSTSLQSPQTGFTVEAHAAPASVWESPAEGFFRSTVAGKCWCENGGDSGSYHLTLYGNEGVGIGNNNIGGGSSDAWFTSPADTFWPTGEWQALRGAFSGDGVKLSVGDTSWDYPPEPPVQCSYESTPLTLGAFHGCCPSPYVGDFVHGSVDSVRIMNRGLYVDEYLRLPLPSWSLGDFAQDADGDGVPEEQTLPLCAGGQTFGCSDNCPDVWNPDQEDFNTVGGGGNACCDESGLGDWEHCMQIDITGTYPVDFTHQIPVDAATAPPGFLSSGGVDFKVVDGWCGVCFAPGSQPTVFPHWLDTNGDAATKYLWFNTGDKVVDSVAVYYTKPGANEVFSKNDLFIRQGGAVQLAYTGELRPDGKFRDTSSHGRHGVAVDGAAADPAGKFGDCINTNGGYVQLPELAFNYGAPSSFSVEAWVKVPNNGERTIASEFGSPFKKGYFYLKNVGGKLKFARYAGEPSMVKYAVTNNYVVPDDIWTYVAATFSSSEGELMRIYVNGSEVSVTKGQEMAPAVADPVVSLVGANEGGQETFNGLLDDVRLHSQKLLPQEITDFYNNMGHTTPAHPYKVLVHKVVAPMPEYAVENVY